jgi:hypothetical protein
MASDRAVCSSTVAASHSNPGPRFGSPGSGFVRLNLVRAKPYSPRPSSAPGYLQLAVADPGGRRLTDAQGRVIDFKNTVIIMTTNLGTRDISKGVSVGFGTSSQSRLV